MEVIRAQSAGACYGVERAVNMALECAHNHTHAQTLGPLIHNPRVVEQLEQQGIGVADRVADATGEAVILRSHGVTPDVIREVEAAGLDMIDATCPHVLRAQQAARKMAEEGLTVMVVGEANHPEVQGLRAWAEDVGGTVIVVANADDIPDKIPEPLGVVVQTTQIQSVLDDVVERLESKGITPTVSNTICNATSKRQDAASALAVDVDAMVVIGGKNSSNTKHLYEICKGLCDRTFHIETSDELRKEDFEGCVRVGVTAGASTPEDQIKAVEDCLHGW